HAKPARKAIADRERREVRVRKEKLKSRSDHLREAQQAFNEFIRWRDRIAGHACISSGLPLDWSGNQTDAGHYRSTGAAPHLRFNENNCHAQRKLDNRYLSGNAVDYRVGLIARIGLAAVEELEADNSVRKYTVEDLKAIKAHYRAKVRELKKRIA
ncbi:TPA: recombination protein NinG, partial [Pseudomonas aeruginosa]|nr:ninG protein [Pseudomonas aeruginosa]HCG1507213.1 recombination protein NinG [Pseudomonas aeruginosa]HCG1514104.1 recombination protein NinG [Pseudomonas aeruginosa]HCG1567102.1 recombination protein NinG [Pseudomonas aeruginosa]HCG1612959.1 recombination protein NinG [Pseudomonas aeruginosa]